MPHWYAILFVVLFYTLWGGSALVIPFALFCAWHGNVWPLSLMVLYYTYRYFYPASEWMPFRHAANLDGRPYFRHSAVIFEEGAQAPKPDSKTMLCVHPHGIISLGGSTLASTGPFFNSKMRWLVADVLFVLPFIQDVMTWANLGPCHKDSMLREMKRGSNIGLLPGGFEEATVYKRNAFRIFIKNRKGFIKYALQHGYKILPSFAFGEETSYYAVESGLSWRLALNALKIPGVIFWSKLGPLPDPDIDINVVVGKPIELPRIENPSDEQITKYHDMYIQRMEQLFDTHKEKYASKDAQLELF